MRHSVAILSILLEGQRVAIPSLLLERQRVVNHLPLSSRGTEANHQFPLARESGRCHPPPFWRGRVVVVVSCHLILSSKEAKGDRPLLVARESCHAPTSSRGAERCHPLSVLKGHKVVIPSLLLETHMVTSFPPLLKGRRAPILFRLQQRQGVAILPLLWKGRGW